MGSDGNLMPITMFKVLYLNTKITNLNNAIEKELNCAHILINAYHKWEYARSQ